MLSIPYWNRVPGLGIGDRIDVKFSNFFPLRMKCYCINKDICILCQEYKYYNIYCTRCVSGKVCYNCSSGMLESSLIKSCPVCRLETTEDKKWYKIKYNPKIIVPINTTELP